MKSTRLATMIFSLASAFATAGHAQSNHSGSNDPPPPRRPPQAAFDACAGKNEGDACSVTFHEHTITGTCANTPESQLACRPDRPPPGPPPPPDRENP